MNREVHPIAVLGGDDVRLDVPTAADIDDVLAACQDPAIARYTAVPSPYARSDAAGFVCVYVPEGRTAYAARGADCAAEVVFAVRHHDRFAGVLGLRFQPAGSAEIGYWLAPGARGLGLLGRAVPLLLGWAFDDPDGPGLDRVVWHAVVGNWASWRVVWRCGFRFSGQVPGGLLHRAGRLDVWTATLCRGDPRQPVYPWPATTVVVDTSGLRERPAGG